MTRREVQRMREKERSSSPRMPLPLWKQGVRKRKESAEIVETRAGAEGREKKGVESIEELLNLKNVLKHK